MKTYRVEGGTALFGPGAVLGLTEKQAVPRALRIDRMGKEGELIVCRTREAIEFKAGEEIALVAAPDKGMAERLVPVGHEDGMPRREPDPAPKAVPAPSAAAKAGGRSKR